MDVITKIPTGKPGVVFENNASRYASIFNPLMFMDDHCYCCVLGNDFRFAIKGFGHTPEEALDDWEVSLRKRIEKPFANDELASFVAARLEKLANAS